MTPPDPIERPDRRTPGRIRAAWHAALERLDRNGPELRQAVRVTVAGLASFALGQALGTAQSYWAVFTAIIVTQTATGGSLGTALDYFAGTLAGAVYGTVVALILPAGGTAMLLVSLAVALAPLAFLAAVRRNFRVAPITGAILLIIPNLQHTDVLASALGRVLEIGIGSIVGLAVSRFVLPARTHDILAETAATILRVMARLMGPLFAGFGGQRDLTGIVRLQDGMRRLFIKVDAVAQEAARERANYWSSEPDPEPVLRALRRLRFDFAVIGRASASILPEPLRPSLLPPLEALAASLRGYLGDLAPCLERRESPPELDRLGDAFAAYAEAMAAMRRAGSTRDLPDEEVARIFALGYALEQLRRNLSELTDRVREFARDP